MNSDAPRVEFSIVSPVYLGARMVEELVTQIKGSLQQSDVQSYEIVLVEDGSPDDSWSEIERLCDRHKEVVGVKLTRNFGQHPAISAGLRCARGEYVAVLDCDLQDDPKYLCDILQLLRSGAPVVFARKGRREHSSVKNITAGLFNLCFNRLAEIKDVSSDSHVGSFSGLSRAVVDEFNKIKDVHRHYLMIVRWLGFPISYVDVTHRPRFEGKSSYTLSKLVRHALDGLTSQSAKLLKLFVIVGFLFCAASLAALALLIALYFLNGFKEGWASVMALMLLSTGIIVFSLGIVGVYVGQILEQARQRPLFIIEKVVSEYE